MARRLEYTITTDPSEGIKGLKQFSNAVKKSMKEIDESTDEAATSGERLAKVLSNLAGDMDRELKSAAAAADALSDALGPELAGRANIPEIIADLNRMGLTFDEITADADKLGDSLKQLDTVQTGGAATKIRDLDDAARRSGAGIDDLTQKTKSADSSASVYANTMGNTAQDVASLAGVSGTAGVAIGQMGEYMADAVSSGEKFSSVLKNFATVAGPIAALAVGFEVFRNVQAQFADSSARTTESVEALSDAISSGAEPVEAFKDQISELGEVTLDVARSQNALQNVAAGIDETFRGLVPQFGLLRMAVGASKDEVENMVPLLNKAGIEVDDWTKIVTGAAGSSDAFAAALAGTTLSSDEQAKILETLSQQQHDYNEAVENGGEFTKFFGEELEKVVDGVKEFMKANKPIGDMQKSWEQARQAVVRMQAGLEPTNRQLLVAGNLSRQYGIDISEVWGRAAQQILDYRDAVEQAESASAEWAAGLVDAVNEMTVSLADAQLELDDMASNFSEMARREDAISDIFDLGNAPVDALAATKDVEDAIRDLGNFIREEGVPDLLDPNDVDAGPYLAKWESLREPIQAKITEAFTLGDPAKAVATAEAYVQQVTQSMRNALGVNAPTEAEVRTLLGLDDLQARVEVAVDMESLAQAKAMLEILTGLPGADPIWKAQILLDLDAGKLDPEAAQVLIADKLAGVGLDVPMELLPPPGSELDQARRDAESWTAAHPVRMPSEVGTPSNTNRMLNDTQSTLNRHPLTIPVRVGAGRFTPQYQDAGGITPPWGGIVGERRPEIINSRYLVTQPTIVPPGTKVTSGARTARILRTRGTTGLRRYDQGGTVAGPRTVNINVNTAVVGNRYDVNRALRRATLENARLLGTRP